MQIAPHDIGYVASTPTDQPDSPAMAAKRNLEGMCSTHGGTVLHQWTARGILLCLSFCNALRPGAKIEEALADAARLFFGEEGSWLASVLENKTLPMPGLNLVRQARIRLDLCSMMFERLLFVTWAYIRYLIIDSSPQLGRNFLCTREDRIRFPRNLLYNSEERSRFDLNSGFESRIMPLTTLGVGTGSALKKSVNCSALYLHESEDLPMFDEIRNEVRGGTTDQGAERNMGDETVRIVPGYEDKFLPADPQSFLWPRSLWIIGHMHVLFNALESACKSVSISKNFSTS